MNTCFLFIWKHTRSFKVMLQKRCIFEMHVFTESCDGFNRNPSENAAVVCFLTPCLSGQSNLSLVVPSNQGQTTAQHLINVLLPCNYINTIHYRLKQFSTMI